MLTTYGVDCWYESLGVSAKAEERGFNFYVAINGFKELGS